MSYQVASTRTEISRQGVPTIYLVDDDPSFLRALSRRLRAADYQVEVFGSAEEFLGRRRSEAAGCAVLDLEMPGPSGLELQESLARAGEPLPVIFLTAHGDISSSVRAMKRGAVDFLTKPVLGDELLDAVRRALARDAAARETRRLKQNWVTRYERLSSREREVFALVVRGLPNKQIADVLSISERTVKAHRCQVMHKMGVKSPAELGRAVEWLGEFFQTAPGAQHGSWERGTGTRLCRASSAWTVGPQFAQRDNSRLTAELRHWVVAHPRMPQDKCTIAIVEDDASFRHAVERLLRASGFEANTFASAEDFLRSTASRSHACLIVDIHLPGMSGVDLIDHLGGSAPAPPTIFITGHDGESLRERVSRIPHSIYLSKPFRGTALLEALHSLLRRAALG